MRIMSLSHLISGTNMIILLSPAKNQNFDNPAPTDQFTHITFQEEVNTLVKCLRQYDAEGLGKLMSISDQLSELNYQRLQTFNEENFDLQHAKQALFAFQGDSYKALNANTLTAKNIAYAQQCLVMLSGLYGLLRPLDLIQAYRLEMKTKLENPKGKDLYAFWGDALTNKLNQWLQQYDNKLLINLASNEYYRAITPNKIAAKVIDIDFKEQHHGQFKTIGIHAKRARGLMARHIICHQIEHVDDLMSFSEAGYQFNQNVSTDNQLTFTR